MDAFQCEIEQTKRDILHYVKEEKLPEGDTVRALAAVNGGERKAFVYHTVGQDGFTVKEIE